MNGLKFIPQIPNWFSSELIQLYQPLTEEVCHWELNENILRDEQTKVTHLHYTCKKCVQSKGAQSLR